MTFNGEEGIVAIMKYIWSKDDIIVGRIVCKNIDFQKNLDILYLATTTYKIGYVAGDEDRYVLLAMTDGMVGKTHTKEALATALNDDDMVPMPHKKLLEVIKKLRDVYEGV